MTKMSSESRLFKCSSYLTYKEADLFGDVRTADASVRRSRSTEFFADVDRRRSYYMTKFANTD